jgi:two-component sensor histidine kinase
MYKLLFFPIFLLAVQFSRAQRILRPAFDSMRRTIDPGKRDTQQIFALLRMAEFYIGKNGEFQQDLDSARNCIERARAMNAVIRSRDATGYVLLAESLLENEEPGGQVIGKKINEQALDSLQQCHNPLLLGKAWRALSVYQDYGNRDQLTIKIAMLEKALACFDQAGAIHMQGDCLEQLADLYVNQGSFRKAEQYGTMAIERFRQIGYPNIQGPAILVAEAFDSEADFNSGMKYALMALAALKATNDGTAQFCQVNYLVAVLFGKLDEWDKAFPYEQAALDWAETHHDWGNMYIVLANMVTAYVRAKQPDKAVALVEASAKTYGIPKDSSRAISLFRDYVIAYSYARQFGKAKIWQERMAGMTAKGFQDKLTISYASLQYYVLSHQFTAASAMAPQFRVLMKEIPDSNYVSICYRWLFQIDTGVHQYGQAVEDLLHHDHLRDSLFNISKTRQIERLQLDYATAEKENSIKLLQKESEIQKIDITRSNETRNYSIAGAALLLAVGFGRYRLKQRQNFQLEAKQREISAKNDQLEKLLRENEWLLREVHHRVKNNLQIVMSLLGSQSARLRDPTALSAVLDSRHRIQSIALIHQKLYKNESVSIVDMAEYIRDMVQYLRDIVKPGQQIVFDVKVEPIALDVVQAVPLGLILNEVVTNSIKYAFLEIEEPLISLKLVTLPTGQICLQIADNGIGLPADLDPFHSTGFGMRLIRGLADELGADVELAREGGTMWKFTFRMVGTPSQKEGF